MAAVASSYARAFADVVMARRIDPAKAMTELHSMLAAFSSSDDLQKVWGNPSISANQKRAVLDGLVSRLGISQEARNFLAVLIDQRRISLLPQVVRQVEQELNDRLGFVEAEITSARPLADDEKRALEQQVGRVTGKSVRARYSQDATLLGGAVVRVGSTVYDGSILGQLTKLREQFAAS